MTIINVSSKLSSNRAFTPFSGGLQFKSRHSGGLHYFYREYIFSVHDDGRQDETSTGVPVLILPAGMVHVIRVVQVWLV